MAEKTAAELAKMIEDEIESQTKLQGVKVSVKSQAFVGWKAEVVSAPAGKEGIAVSALDVIEAELRKDFDLKE